MDIHSKINLKANLYWNFTYPQCRQMLESNRLCLAPYYHLRLQRQNNYLAYRETLPQWVKDMERH